MSDGEYERFEVTDYDLDNEFNTNRPRKKMSKNQMIYGKLLNFIICLHSGWIFVPGQLGIFWPKAIIPILSSHSKWKLLLQKQCPEDRLVSTMS